MSDVCCAHGAQHPVDDQNVCKRHLETQGFVLVFSVQPKEKRIVTEQRTQEPKLQANCPDGLEYSAHLYASHEI